MKNTIGFKLERSRVALLIMYILVIAAYISAAVCVFVNRSVSLWIVNITTLLYVFGVRSADKAYSRKYVNANIEQGLGYRLENVEYIKKGRLTKERFTKSDLLPYRRDVKSFVVRKEVNASFDSRSVSASEITTCYPKNCSEGRKFGFLNGMWIEIAVKSPAADFAYVSADVLEDGFDSSVYSVWQSKVEKNIPSGAVCYADSSKSVPVKQIKSAVGELLKKSDGVAIGMRDGILYAFLSKRSFDVDVPVKEPVREELLKINPIPELEVLIKLSEELKE